MQGDIEIIESGEEFMDNEGRNQTLEISIKGGKANYRILEHSKGRTILTKVKDLKDIEGRKW